MILRRGSGLSVRKQDFRPLAPVMGKLLKIGVPIAIQDGFIQISFIVITVIANRRGLNDAAAVGIVEKIISFLFLVPSSMLSTVSALGAQNMGAGRMDRARKTLGYAIAMAAGFGLAVSVLMQFWLSQWWLSLRTRGRERVPRWCAWGDSICEAMCWTACSRGFIFASADISAPAGNPGSPSCTQHRYLLVRIPGAFLASAYFPDNLFPMGLATSMGSLLSVLICAAAFRVISAACEVRKGCRRG